MSLSDSIDIDSFDTAHKLVMDSVPEGQLENEFNDALTTRLISELDRVGALEVRSDRSRCRNKIAAALNSLQEEKGQEWQTLMRNSKALRYALWSILAARTTISEMPPSVRHITAQFKAVSSAPPAANLKKQG